MAMRIALVLTAAALGLGWVYVLFSLTEGKGLASMDLDEGIMDWIAVVSLSCVAFAFGSEIGWSALLGWVGGQAALLTYDGMPKGRSPQMFQPTNFQEAVLYAVVFVAVLNWSAIPGAIVGFLVSKKLWSGKKSEV